MNSLKNPGHLRALTALSILLASFNGVLSAPYAAADDLNFGGQKWSIVPSGTPDAKKTSEHKSGESAFIQPGGASTFTPVRPNPRPQVDWAQPESQKKTEQASSDSAPAKPLKLYGRIEELSYHSGAKIPLKLQAMVPIRDTSRDLASSKLSGQVGIKSTKLSGFSSGKTDSQISKLNGNIDVKQTLLSGNETEQQEDTSFPIDYVGNWTGQLNVQLVNFDRSYYDFDRAEAEKQERLIKPGIDGKCTVSFYRGSNNKIQVRPTQVVFTIMTNLADEAKDLSNSPLGAMLGGANAANNPMLAGMQVPIPFAIPLGVMSGNTGVTGNQLNSDLVKIDLKEIAKGVLEEQLVTHDSDKNSSGQTRDYYTESVMRFTRTNSETMSMQAASVSYDNQGNYLNKIILSGTLYKGGSTNASPQTYTMFGGDQGQNGQTGGAAGADPLSGLFGGGGGGGGGNGQAGGLFGGGANGQPGGALFGGGNGGANGNGQGGGLLDQVQQMQKMLQDLNNQ